MRRVAVLGLLVASSLWAAPAAPAQTSEELKNLGKEIEALKESQRQIQKDLQEIKSLLRARPGAGPAEPQNVVLSVEDAVFKGDKHARLTLVEFTDYQ